MAAKPTNIYEVLLAVQKDMPDLQKNAINPHFKNSYITLDSLMEQVLPVLHKHDLLMVQAPVVTEFGSPGLRTILAANGEVLEFTMPLVLDRDNPQGQGSAITYGRRYAIMSIFGLVADEDDDGNNASPKPTRSRKKQADEENGDMEL